MCFDTKVSRNRAAEKANLLHVEFRVRIHIGALIAKTGFWDNLYVGF